MKQNEFTKCANCGKGMLHAGSPFFYRAELSLLHINASAVQRQHGLETMMGGNGPIATALGPNEDLAQAINTISILLCSSCAINGHMPIAVLMDEDLQGHG